MARFGNLGTQGNAWLASASEYSNPINIEHVAHLSIFGHSSHGGDIVYQLSQDGENWYSHLDYCEVVSLPGAGSFVFNVPVGSRYIRLQQVSLNGAMTITATIAGKAQA